MNAEIIIKNLELHIKLKDLDFKAYESFVGQLSKLTKEELNYYIFKYSNTKDANELAPTLFLTISTAITIVLKSIDIIDVSTLVFLAFVFGIILYSMHVIKYNNKQKQFNKKIVLILKKVVKDKEVVNNI
ncbi:hypothetical protein [Lactococcus lactis]|uniref:hypothetical protein n=1 Tax=Lactococcus lactis TaxID=1358 RepID=UPI001D0910AE|nr:hypothetical protein [Lactococcus lactis]MCB6852358.1 hypothetical protein [Lactococcus lactis]